MNVPKSIMTALILMLPVSIVIAETESPLLPGTKVVAGDLSKNEFFIVSENETPEIKETIKQNIQKSPPYPLSSQQIKMVSLTPKKTQQNAVRKIAIALKTLPLANNKKDPHRVLTALNTKTLNHDKGIKGKNQAMSMTGNKVKKHLELHSLKKNYSQQIWKTKVILYHPRPGLLKEQKIQS